MLARVFNATDPHPLRSAAAYADMPALQKQIEKNKKIWMPRIWPV